MTMLLVRDIRLPLAAGEQEAVAAALKKTGLPRHGIKNTGIAKLSVDARHGRPSLVYTVALELADEGAERSFERFAPYVSIAAPAAFTVHNGTRPLAHPPVVCGFGPAGLFAALLLARQGSGPSCWSRGPAMEQRAQARWSASTRRACWTKTPISSSEKAARVRFQTASSPHASTTRCVLLSPGRCWRMARPGILPTSRSRTSAPMRCGMLLCLSGGRSRRWAGRCFSTRRSPACTCGTAACGGVHAAGAAALRCAAARARALGPGYI